MAGTDRLADVLSDFARTMITDFPIQAILDRLVERIVDLLPITAAGVTLISPGTDPHYVAASVESALRFEQLQTELGQGPCLAAYDTGGAIAVPDLNDDHRFPTFAPRALEAGLVAVFAFPLRNGNERLGALDLYRNTPGPLDADDMDSAQILADVAAAYLINAQARADLRESSDRSREQAMHDALTGLPNRALLIERLDHAVLRGRRSGKLAAVLFADLDAFKEVNDLHGHWVGDQLLVAVVERLRTVLRPGDTLARLSGDEFVILCEDLTRTGEVDAIAARIGSALEAPFHLADTAIVITASVGIAFTGRGDQLSDDLIQDADTAMYQAKRKGGGRHQVIDLREQRQASERASLERDLRGALDRGELRSVYQPIVRTGDGRVTGAEALVRWMHPSRGLVMPATFVPVAERSGLITGIGRHVLEQACVDRLRWQERSGADDFTVSVNVSTQQLMSPGFVSTVAAVLARTGTEPRLVTLEVTESVFIQDSARALVVLTDLDRLGVILALDDFGTGYSSLTYLRRFPIGVVKIDREFVADRNRDTASQAIVVAIVGLARTLGITVVAEGIETTQEHRWLKALGCELCQGYYFARPMPADDLDALMVECSQGSGALLPALTPG